MESGGVTFLVPLETGFASDGDAGFNFDGETLKANTRGGILYVARKSYGSVRRGDVVDLTSHGKVLINGLEKHPLPEVVNTSGGTVPHTTGKRDKW